MRCVRATTVNRATRFVQLSFAAGHEFLEAALPSSAIRRCYAELLRLEHESTHEQLH